MVNHYNTLNLENDVIVILIVICGIYDREEAGN